MLYASRTPREGKPAYLEVVLVILEDAVQDPRVRGGVQKNPLGRVSDVVNGKRTVPPECPRHGLQHKGRSSETLPCAQPRAVAQALQARSSEQDFASSVR